MARTLIGNIKGPKGDTGDTGATGATGAAGASASVSVGTVTALEYGNNPTVTNSGSAQNAVFNFGIPKGKPGDNITELDNLPVNSSVTPSADFPVPAVGDTSKTILGKIIKWFGDMSALVATKFNAANVYNGLDKTESGYALDARQGKALDDTKLNVANVVNNLTTTASGYALDARQGKALNDSIEAISNQARIIFVKGGYTGTTGKCAFDFTDNWVGRRPWLLIGSNVIVTISFANATSPVMFSFGGLTPTITSTGDRKIEVTGMAWYDEPFAISFNF